MTRNENAQTGWFWQALRRLVVLMLLVGAASILLWPNQPQWRLGRESVLGIDQSDTLLTTLVHSQGLQLHGYSIPSVDLVRNCTLISKPMLARTSESDEVTFPNLWLLVLSDDGKTIVCMSKDEISTYNAEQHTFMATMDIASKKIRLADDFGTLVQALNISPDGNLIAADCWGTINVWNAHTGELLHHFIPTTVESEGGIGGFGFSGPPGGCEPERISFSYDGRLLAIAIRKRNVVVIDLKSKSEIGRIFDKDIPLFLPDGSLIASCGLGFDLEYKHYHIKDKQLVEQFSKAKVPDEPILAMNKRGVLTGDIKKTELPGWFPDSIKKWWRGRQMTVSVPMNMKWWLWDSSQPKQQITIDVSDYFGHYGRSNYGHSTTFTVTKDDRKVIIMDANGITAWSLTGWPWYRWVLLMLPILMILVMLRPRKVIPSGSRPL